MGQDGTWLNERYCAKHQAACFEDIDAVGTSGKGREDFVGPLAQVCEADNLNGTAPFRCAAGGVRSHPPGKLPFLALQPFFDLPHRAWATCCCAPVQIPSG